MSQGPWKAKAAKEAERLVKLAQDNGYIVTSIQTFQDGTARVDMKRPGDAGLVSEAEQLRSNL